MMSSDLRSLRISRNAKDSREGKVANFGPPNRVILSHSRPIPLVPAFKAGAGMTKNDGMGNWMASSGALLIPSFLVQSSHSKPIPVIPAGWGHKSFQVIPYHSWQWDGGFLKITQQTMIFMLGMTKNDRMTMEWWDAIRMT